MIKKQLITLLLLSLCFVGATQNTVGLISHDSTQSFAGYNLFYPHNQSTVFLLDNCGQLVHSWIDDVDFRPGNTAYITSGGNLYKTKRPASTQSSAIWAGGGGANIEIRDWSNNLIWDFEMNNDSQRLHHDIAVLPNGNVLAIAWELKTLDECLAAGRDTSTLSQGELWPDWIVELDPGTNEIVWEWHAWDHLIQDFDASKANFGVVADHPERIDINYGRPNGHPDWMHSNSIDYNAELDQIMLSVPYFDEIWIIDHSTTTEEAAGSTGGLSGKGGDLLFRWGNPRTYRQGDQDDQQLFFQHDAHWIDEYLSPDHPYYGMLGVFNNRIGEDYSSVNVIDPGWDAGTNNYQLNGNGTFLPDNFTFTAVHPQDSTRLFSTGLSGVQYLPNENMLVTVGRTGYVFEMTRDGEIVWEYITPLSAGMPVGQGDTTLVSNSNLTFRVDRYPTDFPAFEGKDLGPKGYMELNPNIGFCGEVISSLADPELSYELRVFPNPSNGVLNIQWSYAQAIDIKITNMLGQVFEHIPESEGGSKQVSTANWPEGFYLILIDNRFVEKLIVQR